MDFKIFRFLKEYQPFQLLKDQELEELVGNLEKREFEADEMIYQQKVSEVGHVSIVYKGKVEKYLLSDKKNRKFIEDVKVGESFGEISILLNSNNAVATVRTVEPTILYNLPSTNFLLFCHSNKDFANYFTDRVGQRMFNDRYGLYVAQMKEQIFSYEDSDVFFTQKLKSLNVREIISVVEQTPIKDVAALMTAEKIGCVLVKNKASEYIGYVTDLEFRDNVVVTGHDVNASINEIMGTPIVSISEDSLVYEALLMMFQSKINYLVIKKSTQFTGIITRNKLLSSKAKSPFVLIQSIKLAHSVEELTSKWKNVSYIVVKLLDRGVKAEIINQLITAFSDAITINIIERAIREAGKIPVDFAFLALGGVGRKDSTLSLEQENAIIFQDVPEKRREAIQNYFMVVGQSVNDALDEIGLTYNPFGLMAGNPEWCDSLSRWKYKYKGWVQKPTPDTAFKSISFFDSRLIYGNEKIMDDFQDDVVKLLRKPSRPFFSQLDKIAVEHRAPLTFFKSFQLFSKDEYVNVLDIKKAMTPIVDFARIYALSNGIRTTNTTERLLALLDKGSIRKKEYYELIQAYHFMMFIRLKHQTKMMTRKNKRPNNLVEPDKLTNIERVTLKEVFKVVDKYQSRLTQELPGFFKKLSSIAGT